MVDQEGQDRVRAVRPAHESRARDAQVGEEQGCCVIGKEGIGERDGGVIGRPAVRSSVDGDYWVGQRGRGEVLDLV